MTETAPGAITRDELADALAALKITPEDENTFYPAVADAIFAHVARNREPRPGAYEDPEGSMYVRVHGLDAWLRVMDDGTTEVRPDDWPERPLRRLVPEPEPVKPDREAIAREIFEGWRRNRAPDEIAAGVCRLLEGTDD